MAPGPIPKQATTFEASHLQELQGNVSETVIQASMGFVGPIPEGGVVHDNACGSGSVTECLMRATDPPPPKEMHIDATDNNANFVRGVAALAEQHGWPVTAATMDTYDLTFPDDHFDQSYTTFAFHCLADGAKAAANIHRTLKPDGKICAAVWVDMPHIDAIQRAHWATRGDDGPMPALLHREAYTVEQLKLALSSGGFDESKMEVHFVGAKLRVPDVKRWSQLAWSYLGGLSHGWDPDDEAKWDQALAEVEEGMKTGRNTTVEDGVLTVTMTAAVGIATK